MFAKQILKFPTPKLFISVPELHEVGGKRPVDSTSPRVSRTQAGRSMGPLRRKMVRGFPGWGRSPRLPGGHQRGRPEDRSPQHPRAFLSDCQWERRTLNNQF